VSTTRATANKTEDKILDVTEQLVQTRGFNGFSYADIASQLRIQKASIHYYFPTKADLGRAVIDRYHQAFNRELERIAHKFTEPRKKLEQYVQLYDDVLREKNRVCLCGMLAADFTTLPKGLRARVAAFFEDNERWLVQVLEAGRKAKSIHFRGKAEVAARSVLGTLEGAMLVARAYGDPVRFESVAEKLLADFEIPGAETQAQQRGRNLRRLRSVSGRTTH
jgi:TetR/AcrR family transcriptional repressor of nem operon